MMNLMYMHVRATPMVTVKMILSIIDIKLFWANAKYHKPSVATSNLLFECTHNPVLSTFLTIRFFLQAMEVNRYDNDPLINEFGMKFNPELTKVNGRVLEPPQVRYRASNRCSPLNLCKLPLKARLTNTSVFGWCSLSLGEEEQKCPGMGAGILMERY